MLTLIFYKISKVAKGNECRSVGLPSFIIVVVNNQVLRWRHRQVAAVESPDGVGKPQYCLELAHVVVEIFATDHCYLPRLQFRNDNVAEFSIGFIYDRLANGKQVTDQSFFRGGAEPVQADAHPLLHRYCRPHGAVLAKHRRPTDIQKMPESGREDAKASTEVLIAHSGSVSSSYLPNRMWTVRLQGILVHFSASRALSVKFVTMSCSSSSSASVCAACMCSSSR